MRKLLLTGPVLLAVLAGCTTEQSAEIREDVRGIRQEIATRARDARQAAVDAALEGKVKACLASRKGLDPREIRVEARGGAVTLKGEVPTREQAEIAEETARNTEGVDSVTNELMLRVPAKNAPLPQGPPPAGWPGGSR